MGGRKKDPKDKVSLITVSVPNYVLDRLAQEDERQGFNMKSRIVTEALVRYLDEIQSGNQAWEADLERIKEFSTGS